MPKGKICLIISAFLYGIVPLMTKISSAGGADGITLTFLRASLALPVLYILMKTNGVSMKLSACEKKRIVLLGVFGGAIPILLLYASYNFISTGLATTLHFIYPLITVIASALLYKEKIPMMKIVSSAAVTIGIFLFADIESASDTFGILLALLSGICYSFYVVYIERSGLDEMDYRKLTFYVLIIMSVSSFLCGVVSGGMSFKFTMTGWIFAAAVSLVVTLGAMPLFQAGVRYEGASTAGIISTVEPITSVIMGAVFLGEKMGVGQIIGIGIILAGLVFASR